MTEKLSGLHSGSDEAFAEGSFTPVIGVHISRQGNQTIASAESRAGTAAGDFTANTVKLSKVELPAIKSVANRINLQIENMESSLSRPTHRVPIASDPAGRRSLTDRRPQTAQNKVSICTIGQDIAFVGSPVVMPLTGRPHRPFSARTRTSESPRSPVEKQRVRFAPSPGIQAASFAVGNALGADGEAEALCDAAATLHEPQPGIPIQDAGDDNVTLLQRGLGGSLQDAARPSPTNNVSEVHAFSRPASARPLKQSQAASVRPASSRNAAALPFRPSPPRRRLATAGHSGPRPAVAAAAAVIQVDEADPRASARRLVRQIGGLGNHLEREAAARSLLDLVQAGRIDCEWLALQGALPRGLASLCRCGTHGQREQAARLLRRLAAGPAPARRAVSRAEGLGEGLAAVLRAAGAGVDALAPPALETVRLLAEDEGGREALGAVQPLVSALVEAAAWFLGAAKQAAGGARHAPGPAAAAGAAREALAALRGLAFRSPVNCRALAREDQLARLAADGMSSAVDPDLAVHAVALAAEVSSFPAGQNEQDFRRALAAPLAASAAGGNVLDVAAVLVGLLQRSGPAELHLHTLIVARNLLEVEEGKAMLLRTLPAVFRALERAGEGLEAAGTAGASSCCCQPQQVGVAILDFLRIALAIPEFVSPVSEFRGLDELVVWLLQICKEGQLDRVLAFFCWFSEKCPGNCSVNQNTIAITHVVNIMNRDVCSVSAKLCSTIIWNLSKHSWDESNSVLESSMILDCLYQMATDFQCIGQRQAFCALCNLARQSNLATAICKCSKFVDFLINSLACDATWLLNCSALMLHNLVVHKEVALKLGGDKVLIHNLLSFSLDQTGTASPASRIYTSISLAYMTCNSDCCDVLVSGDPASVVKLFHVLFLSSGSSSQDRPASATGMWAVNNLASRSEKIRICLGLVGSPLESLIQILSEEGTDNPELEAAISLLKVSIVNHSENSKLLMSFQRVNAVKTICSMVLRGHPVITRDSLVVLCCLTAESDSARNKRYFTNPILQVLAKGLHSIDSELLLASAGLICNLAQSEDSTSLLEELGRFPKTYSALLTSARFGSAENVRAGAILALCALAKADSNKLVIGKEPELQSVLNHVLTYGSSAEKANMALLVYHLSFVFSYNSSLGQVCGILGHLVEMVEGDQDQAEKSTAALGVLGCCSANASALISDYSERLLKGLTKLISLGTDTQRINAMVCLWNLARSNDKAKHQIGLMAGVFQLLLKFMDHEQVDIKWHATGLVAELMKNSDRNSSIFLKIPGALDKILKMALICDDKKILPAACSLIVNFALNDDEGHLKAVFEHEEGLLPIVNLTRIGVLDDRERALQLLAHPFFRSLEGRHRILLVPEFVLQLPSVVLRGSDKEKEQAAMILHNLSVSQSTRQAVLEIQNIFEVIQKVIPDTCFSKKVRGSILGCVSNLVQDPDFCHKIIESQSIVMSIIDLIFLDDENTLEYSVGCLHYILSTAPEFCMEMSKNERLVDRLVVLTGNIDSDRSDTALNAGGAIFQMSKVGPKSPALPPKLLTHPLLIPNLLQSMNSGNDKRKEFACACLAVLGENDDDVTSMTDDMFNMMIAMGDGAIEILTRTFFYGTAVQRLHVTAIFSNMLVSTGAFIKAQLAESKDFFPVVLHFIRSDDAHHSMFALRLFFHLIKNDPFIIERACEDVHIIEALYDISESGQLLNQKMYACLCLSELGLYRGFQLCDFKSGKIFHIISQTLARQEKILTSPIVALLKHLAAYKECDYYVWRISGLFNSLTTIPEPEHQDLVIDTLLTLTHRGVQGQNSDCVNTVSFKRYLSSALRAENAQTRQKAARVLVNLCNDPTNVEALALSDLPLSLFELLLSGEVDEVKMSCRVLSFLLNSQSYSSIDCSSNLQDILSCLLSHLSSSEQDKELVEDVLRCLLGLSSTPDLCKTLALPASLELIFLHAKPYGRLGCSDIIIAILYRVMKSDPESTVNLSKSSLFFECVLNSLKGTLESASLGLKCMVMLSKSQPDVSVGLRKAPDFWSILLLFLDDRIFASKISATQQSEYDGLRLETLEIIRAYAQMDGCLRGITAQRQAVPILARLIVYGARGLRRAGLLLIQKCCDEESHFSKILGSDTAFVSKLIDIVARLDRALEPIDPADRLSALKILTLVARAEQHCLRIGHAKGFLQSLFQSIRQRHSLQVETRNAMKEPFARASSSDSANCGLGAWTVLEMFERQASSSILHFCSKRPTAEFAIRIPFPVLESLLAAATSAYEADRVDAIEILLCIATSGDQALMILGMRGEEIFRTLASILRLHPQQRQRTLILTEALVVNQNLGRALVDSYEVVGALSNLLVGDDLKAAMIAAQVIESVVLLDKSHKSALGQMPALVDALVRSQMRGSGVSHNRHNNIDGIAASAAAEKTIRELSQGNNANAHLFRRLQEKYNAAAAASTTATLLTS